VVLFVVRGPTGQAELADLAQIVVRIVAWVTAGFSVPTSRTGADVDGATDTTTG
jgi:hypothetical protein